MGNEFCNCLLLLVHEKGFASLGSVMDYVFLLLFLFFLSMLVVSCLLSSLVEF
uniref:UDP-3-O-3-hydroxymyristoyl N-acetylglucosamine deacetylase n=1 Tax=Rhizophora mucronata TaxID=61149 RepID=A0A2P2K9P6_RHIMU